MPTRIRLEPTRCKREGWRAFERVPTIPIAIGCSLVALTGVALAASHTGFPLWIVLAATALVLGGPVLAVGESALYRFHNGERWAVRELLGGLTPRAWLVTLLTILWIVAVLVGGTAIAMVIYVRLLWALFAALAFATFGETLEAYVFGGALAGSLFAGPMLAIAFGWLFVPLHAVIDGDGPITALRKSWNTTYGSKRALLRLAFPIWIAIIAFAFTAFFPLHPWRSLGGILRGVSYVFPLVLALVLGPRFLSAAVSGYITLQHQREQDKAEARHWLRP